MSDQGNIFFTYENLAFSLPLISVVTIYLFFKFVPPVVSALLIGGALMVYQIRKQLAAVKERKLQNLDDDAVREILGELEDEAAAEADGKQLESKRKAKNKLQQRLAQERKAEARTKASSTSSSKMGKKAAEDDDDEDDLLQFAKGSRQSKNKNQ